MAARRQQEKKMATDTHAAKPKKKNGEEKKGNTKYAEKIALKNYLSSLVLFFLFFPLTHTKDNYHEIYIINNGHDQ